MSGRLIERAFQLAPEFVSLDDLRKKLRGEGYGYAEVHISLSGRLF